MWAKLPPRAKTAIDSVFIRAILAPAGFISVPAWSNFALARVIFLWKALNFMKSDGRAL
ncbi:MAG TPA: hypothetical protein IAB50_01395 [Candidatus Faecivicinus avistercoris]|nr:hypothetical protein [Candidatus Faecivicinus avistercoris]